MIENLDASEADYKNIYLTYVRGLRKIVEQLEIEYPLDTHSIFFCMALLEHAFLVTFRSSPTKEEAEQLILKMKNIVDGYLDK